MLERCINIVNTMPSVKAKWLQIRIREDIKGDFQKVAELRGLSASALITSLIVKAIREEKEREPRAFLDDTPKETRAKRETSENTSLNPRRKALHEDKSQRDESAVSKPRARKTK